MSTKDKTDLRQVNIQLSADLHKRLRIRAIEEDRTMSEIISTLVEGYLARQPPSDLHKP